MGWSVLVCPGSLALLLGAGFLSTPRARPALALHALVSVAFVVWVGEVAVPTRIDEAHLLLATVAYRAVIWAVCAAGILWVDEAPQGSPRGLVAAAAGAATICLWPALIGGPGDSPSRPRISFLWPEAGTSAATEFATAQGAYGFANIGLYGEWPAILERAGYPLTRLTKLDPAALSRTDLLVVVSAFRDWLPGEVEAVTHWVRAGGRLLAVGEHSDLDKCQQRLNPLLAEFGLGLRFDTTNGLLGDGLRGVILAANPFRRVLDGVPLLPYNRGASLDVGSGARPRGMGRYWHADAGDGVAPDRAFLSDYRVSRGDRVGDVVLMALHEGRGRVLLVGDSTPFLAQNTLYAAPFLLALPRYLAAPASHGSAGVAGLTILVLALVLESRRPYWRILVLLSVASAAAALHPRSRPPDVGDARLGVVSFSENNVFNLDPFSGRSPTALGLAFSRRGLVPMLADWERLERRPTVVAVLNPSRPPNTDRLAAWVREGTILLLAGDGDNPAFRSAAAKFGALVSERILGNLKGPDFTTYTSWEVRALPSGARPLSAGSFLVGGIVPLGKGRVVVFADGGFFLSKNLEMETAFDETNLAFLSRLLEEPAP